MAMAMTVSRPARLSQAVMAMAMTAAISEPETAVLLKIAKPNAGAALRRPGCRASS
jgi:hypothetical protein